MREPASYFERDADGLRLKGHRIWLEDILGLYLDGLTAEQIVDGDHYPTITLDEAQAAIAYYHERPAEIDAYLAQQQADAEARERSAIAQPSERASRLRALLEERERHETPQA